MRRHHSSALIVLLCAMPVVAFSQDATGVWRTEPTKDGYLEVQIAPCGPSLCGTILRARDLTGKEQPYAYAGRKMLWDMAAAGPGQWTDGKIWDPRNDRTFNSRMERQGDKLSVSGCVLGICQSQVWEPVD